MTDAGLPPVSVVIPTYNRAPRLRMILAAVLADPGASEVVVVSDASTDGTASVVTELAADDNRLRLLELSVNAGPQQARLRGVDSVTHSLVLLLDDDVLVAPGCVSGHARHHADPGRVVVGHMPVAPELAARDLLARRYAERYDRHVETWRRDPAAVLRGLWAGNVSLPTGDYLAAARRTDPALRQHEDQELGLLLLEAGLDGVFDDRLESVHLYERTLAGTLVDAHRSGAAYASLVLRHPEHLAPPELVFDIELRHRGLRLAQDVLSVDIVRQLITAVAGVLVRRGPSRVAGLVVSLLSRAAYVSGFEAAGQRRVATLRATSASPAA